MLGRAGDIAVLRYRKITIVPDNIRIVFHALNDICSEGGGGLISGVVDKLETFTVCAYLRLYRVSVTNISLF